MNGEQMTLQLAGRTAYVVGTPSATLFADFDDDDSGTLEPRELQAHRDAILERFHRGLRLRDQRGRRGTVILRDVSHVHSHGREAYVRITLHLRWDEAPDSLRLRYAHGARAPLQLLARRLTAARVRSEQRPAGPVVQIDLSGEPQTHALFGGAR